MKNHLVLISSILVALVLGFGLHFFLGAGAFDRHFTLSGIYAVCKPKGYDAVCFLDADSKEGGLSCLPLSAVGGKCH
jgi:hypothetical protein